MPRSSRPAGIARARRWTDSKPGASPARAMLAHVPLVITRVIAAVTGVVSSIGQLPTQSGHAHATAIAADARSKIFHPMDRSAGVLPSFRGMMFSVRRPGGYAMSKSDLIALAIGAIVATVTYCWSRWVRLRASQRYWDAWRKNLPADSDEMIEKKGHFRTESDSPESKSTERAA